MARSNFARYNDGVVSIYRDNTTRTGFGAKTNVTAMSGLTFVVKLAFEEMSKRIQDQEFAEQAGFSLEMKVRTPHFGGTDNKCKAVIGNRLYDISYIDKGKTSDYLYLQGVRDIDT